jgi:hypothetical protein
LNGTGGFLAVGRNSRGGSLPPWVALAFAVPSRWARPCAQWVRQGSRSRRATLSGGLLGLKSPTCAGWWSWRLGEGGRRQFLFRALRVTCSLGRHSVGRHPSRSGRLPDFPGSQWPAQAPPKSPQEPARARKSVLRPNRSVPGSASAGPASWSSWSPQFCAPPRVTGALSGTSPVTGCRLRQACDGQADFWPPTRARGRFEAE